MRLSMNVLPSERRAFLSFSPALFLYSEALGEPAVDVAPHLRLLFECRLYPARCRAQALADHRELIDKLLTWVDADGDAELGSLPPVALGVQQLE
jgi:hypothetical protein